MSHEIETHEGQAAFYSTQREWHHGLTQHAVVPEGLSPLDAMASAHLTGWNVRKTPLSTRVGSSYLRVPDRYAIIRDNPFTTEPEVLGDASEKYHAWQNEHLAEFASALVGESSESLTAQVAASLFGGRQVFLSLKFPADITLDVEGVKDVTDFYLLLTTGHTGSSATRVDVTAVRAVCANTLPLAQAAADRTWSMWHLQPQESLAGKAAEAQAVLGIGYAYAEAFEAEARAFLAAPCTTDTFEQIMARAFPLDSNASKLQTTNVEKRRTQVRELLAAPTNAPFASTAWGAYNALTEWSDWHAPVVGGDDQQQAERRFASKTFGKGVEWKRQAEAIVRETCAVG